MPKYKGKEKRVVSRYRVTEKALLIIGTGSSMHTIHAELRSIGLGGALVRVLGAFVRDEKITKGSRFILEIAGEGPLRGISVAVVVVEENPGAYSSKCYNLSFEGPLQRDNYDIFMRWRRHQTAIGRMMPSKVVWFV